MNQTLSPAKRMLMGLIEHTVNFLNAEHVNEVSNNSLLLFVIRLCMHT